MEANVINSFLPDLVTAVGTTVQSVSDQCLAKGLIPGNVHDQVLESGGTSKEKARTLILAVKRSTETDSRCLEILLNILDQELPFAIRENLLSKIRKELTKKANTSRAVVPLSKAVQQEVPLEELSKEIHQSSLLGRFEDSIRQHEHACAEKKLLEERLNVKAEKCERLREELEALNSQNQELASITRSKIETCADKIVNLEKRIKELQKNIEEQDMQARRGRNTIITETKKAFVLLVQQSKQEIKRKEEELNGVLREAEASKLIKKKAEEEIKMKDREYNVIVKEKEVRIRELEVESKQQKDEIRELQLQVGEPLTIGNAFNRQRVSGETENTDHDLPSLKIIKRRTLPPHMSGRDGFIPLTEQHHDILLKQLKKHAQDWKEIGKRLGFTAGELGNIEGRPLLQEEAPVSWLSAMLKEWFIWHTGDSRRSTNSATLADLKAALRKAKFVDTARTLTASLPKSESI